MIYYTADLHLCHKNIIDICIRPFKDIDQMNNTIIQNWNKKINNKDTVYIIGDIAYPKNTDDVIQVIKLLKRLNGNKILIQGNHDWRLLKNIEFCELFKIITIYKEIKDNDRRVVLFHYPIEDWNYQRYGSYHIHGHVHDNIVINIPNRFNAGVDVQNFYPVTLDELIKQK